MQDLRERQVKELEWRPLDQEVLVSFGPEISAGFLCVCSDAENVLKKSPGLVKERHCIEF